MSSAPLRVKSEPEPALDRSLTQKTFGQSRPPKKREEPNFCKILVLMFSDLLVGYLSYKQGDSLSKLRSVSKARDQGKKLNYNN
jgi:hypothetical protein